MKVVEKGPKGETLPVVAEVDGETRALLERVYTTANATDAERAKIAEYLKRFHVNQGNFRHGCWLEDDCRRRPDGRSDVYLTIVWWTSGEVTLRRMPRGDHHRSCPFWRLDEDHSADEKGLSALLGPDVEVSYERALHLHKPERDPDRPRRPFRPAMQRRSRWRVCARLGRVANELMAAAGWNVARGAIGSNEARAFLQQSLKTLQSEARRFVLAPYRQGLENGIRLSEHFYTTPSLSGIKNLACKVKKDWRWPERFARYGMCVDFLASYPTAIPCEGGQYKYRMERVRPFGSGDGPAAVEEIEIEGPIGAYPGRFGAGSGPYVAFYTVAPSRTNVGFLVPSHAFIRPVYEVGMPFLVDSDYERRTARLLLMKLMPRYGRQLVLEKPVVGLPNEAGIPILPDFVLKDTATNRPVLLEVMGSDEEEYAERKRTRVIPEMWKHGPVFEFDALAAIRAGDMATPLEAVFHEMTECLGIKPVKTCA